MRQLDSLSNGLSHLVVAGGVYSRRFNVRQLE